MVGGWKDIPFLLRKITISPMRLLSLRRLPLNKQFACIRALIRTPIVIELHRLQTTDTMRITAEPLEIEVKDYDLERRRLERIQTEEHQAIQQSLRRTYYEWPDKETICVASLLRMTIGKFQREYRCQPKTLFIAQEHEEAARAALDATCYQVFGHKHMPRYAAVAERSE